MAEEPTHTTETIDDGLLICFGGEIDYSNSPDLRHVIHQALARKPDRLIIDLTGVPYMDSSGVAVLVEALQGQTKNKKQLILSNLQTKVQGIFEIARLDTVFQITDDIEQAKQIPPAPPRK